MVIGLFLYACGIVVTLKANIGYAPWEVFHAGLSGKIGLSFGLTSIFVGFIIIVITAFLGEKIGLGTISNMILIGLFIDAILFINIIPVSGNLMIGIIMLVTGLFIVSIGTYFYIKSAFGAGPRDGLMIAFTRKTKIPVGICRSIIELLATFAGWRLGGMAGIGTVISVVSVGFCIQITFKILRFDVAAIRHESLFDTFACLSGKKNGETP